MLETRNLSTFSFPCLIVAGGSSRDFFNFLKHLSSANFLITDIGIFFTSVWFCSAAHTKEVVAGAHRFECRRCLPLSLEWKAPRKSLIGISLSLFVYWLAYQILVITAFSNRICFVVFLPPSFFSHSLPAPSYSLFPPFCFMLLCPFALLYIPNTSCSLPGSSYEFS